MPSHPLAHWSLSPPVIQPTDITQQQVDEQHDNETKDEEH